MNPSDSSLRGVFDSAAHDYDDVRPGYPMALIKKQPLQRISMPAIVAGVSLNIL